MKIVIQLSNIGKSINGGSNENTAIKRKKMIDDNENNSVELYGKYLMFNDVMLEDYDPLEVAAVMIAQGLSLYRTILSEEDYNQMVDNISDLRDQVHVFEGPDLE
jgi:hypothetical protein